MSIFVLGKDQNEKIGGRMLTGDGSLFCFGGPLCPSRAGQEDEQSGGGGRGEE